MSSNSKRGMDMMFIGIRMWTLPFKFMNLNPLNFREVACALDTSHSFTNFTEQRRHKLSHRTATPCGKHRSDVFYTGCAYISNAVAQCYWGQVCVYSVKWWIMCGYFEMHAYHKTCLQTVSSNLWLFMLGLFIACTSKDTWLTGLY